MLTEIAAPVKRACEHQPDPACPRCKGLKLRVTARERESRGFTMMPIGLPNESCGRFTDFGARAVSLLFGNQFRMRSLNARTRHQHQTTSR